MRTWYKKCTLAAYIKFVAIWWNYKKTKFPPNVHHEWKIFRDIGARLGMVKHSGTHACCWNSNGGHLCFCCSREQSFLVGMKFQTMIQDIWDVSHIFHYVRYREYFSPRRIINNFTPVKCAPVMNSMNDVWWRALLYCYSIIQFQITGTFCI